MTAKNKSETSFVELLKEFHDTQDMLRVEAERIDCTCLTSTAPVLEHYIEGRASWVFDMDAPFKLNEVGSGSVVPHVFPRTGFPYSSLT